MLYVIVGNYKNNVLEERNDLISYDFGLTISIYELYVINLPNKAELSWYVIEYVDMEKFISDNRVHRYSEIYITEWEITIKTTAYRNYNFWVISLITDFLIWTKCPILKDVTQNISL